MAKCILVTPGEPAGIGPEIVLHLSQKSFSAIPVIVADPKLLQQRIDHVGMRLTLEVLDDLSSIHYRNNTLYCYPVPLSVENKIGVLNKQNAEYVLQCLEVATTFCLQNKAQAIVTGPVHKGIIRQTGIDFTGHTEYLAKICNTTQPVMMLSNGKLNVALVTTHIPLSKVSQSITQEKITHVATVLNNAFITYFGHKPRISVCGLNPHAGEDGQLGWEDKEIITPSIKQLKQAGVHIAGPYAADTVFVPHHLQETDVILTMYHDQGLPVLKSQSFGNAINITLGLPIIRCSVDHGTALDIATRGVANPSSLFLAMEMAEKMIQSHESKT